jgi:hypothetical protein
LETGGRLVKRLLVFATLSAGLAVWAQSTWGQYYVDNRASTPGESYARGLGDVIRSAGQYNLQTSEAAINAEEARSKYLDNRIKGTQTYFEMRKMNQEYRAAEKRPPPSSADLARYAHNAGVKRLSPSQLDAVDGAIEWPLVLQSPEFAAARTQLDALFAARATGAAGWSVASYATVQELVDAMQRQLQGLISKVSAENYVYAKKFLESLAYEAGQPPHA